VALLCFAANKGIQMPKLMQQLSVMLVSLLLLGSSQLAAVEVDALYLADVSADQPQRQWQNTALAQVMTRLTGITDFSKYPQVTAELNNAGRYVKQFESQRQNGDNRLKVLLDASLINPLLQQQGIAIWGAHRPETLLWIVQQNGSDRQFLRKADDELVSALLQNLAENRIPVTLPLYDIDDLLQLTETDVWAGFWQSINQASMRYRADMVIIATLDEVNRNGENFQRLSWQRQSPAQGTNQYIIVRNEVIAADIVTLANAFSAVLTAELAAEQAVVLQAKTANYQLVVANLTNLADVVAVERLLERMLGVSSVTLNQFAADRAQFTVTLQIELAQLTRHLQWEPSLMLMDNTEADVYSRLNETKRNLPIALIPVQRIDANYRFVRR
jgi:hypothetical protein